MSKKPKWLANLGSTETTRKRSGRQETNLAKKFKGRTTSNSGAALGQNDVLTEQCEIEAKVTAKNSFSVRLSDLEKMHNKCSADKFSVMVINFEGQDKSFAVIGLNDFQYLLNK